MNNDNMVRVKPVELVFRNESAKSLLGLAFIGAAAIEGAAIFAGYKIITKVRNHIEEKRSNNTTN